MRTFKLLFLFLLSPIICSSALSAQEMLCDNFYQEFTEDLDCDDEGECCYYNRCAYIGPEFYHVKRVKKGGTHQSGYLYGVKAGYDYIKRYSLYVGFDGSYATGRLKGESGGGSTLVSQLTDLEGELRLGYTLQLKNSWRPTLVPFAGLGYFYQTNKFRSPSPLTLHFKDSFAYMTAGFLSSVMLTCNLSFGFNFKARYMWEGKDRITHDPDFPNITLLMSEKTQYCVELPITYYKCFWDTHELSFSVVPFYEVRHYGGEESFPFDFIDTKFYDVGARFLFGYCF